MTKLSFVFNWYGHRDWTNRAWILRHTYEYILNGTLLLVFISRLLCKSHDYWFSSRHVLVRVLEYLLFLVIAQRRIVIFLLHPMQSEPCIEWLSFWLWLFAALHAGNCQGLGWVYHFGSSSLACCYICISHSCQVRARLVQCLRSSWVFVSASHVPERCEMIRLEELTCF